MIACAGTLYGAVKHIPVRSGVVLKPDAAYTAQVESTKPVEIGLDGRSSATLHHGLRADDSDERNLAPTVRGGAGSRRELHPTDGKVVVEFKNVSQEPVTIDVIRVERNVRAFRRLTKIDKVCYRLHHWK